MESVKNILLPHQLGRLEQLVRQKPLKLVARDDRFKLYLLMAHQIGLSEDEIKALEKIIKSERKEFEQKLERLMVETDEAVFSHLTEDAQQRLKEAFGRIGD